VLTKLVLGLLSK